MRRFRSEAIVTAGSLGFPSHVATRFLSSKPHNAYHPSRARAYYRLRTPRQVFGF